MQNVKGMFSWSYSFPLLVGGEFNGALLNGEMIRAPQNSHFISEQAMPGAQSALRVEVNRLAAVTDRPPETQVASRYFSKCLRLEPAPKKPDPPGTRCPNMVGSEHDVSHALRSSGGHFDAR